MTVNPKKVLKESLGQELKKKTDKRHGMIYIILFIFSTA